MKHILFLFSFFFAALCSAQTVYDLEGIYVCWEDANGLQTTLVATNWNVRTARNPDPLETRYYRYDISAANPVPVTPTGGTITVGACVAPVEPSVQYQTELEPFCLDTGTDTIQAFLVVELTDGTETAREFQDANGTTVTGTPLSAKDCDTPCLLPDSECWEYLGGIQVCTYTKTLSGDFEIAYFYGDDGLLPLSYPYGLSTTEAARLENDLDIYYSCEGYFWEGISVDYTAVNNTISINITGSQLDLIYFYSRSTTTNALQLSGFIESACKSQLGWVNYELYRTCEGSEFLKIDQYGAIVGAQQLQVKKDCTPPPCQLSANELAVIDTTYFFDIEPVCFATATDTITAFLQVSWINEIEESRSYVDQNGTTVTGTVLNETDCLIGLFSPIYEDLTAIQDSIGVTNTILNEIVDSIGATNTTLNNIETDIETVNTNLENIETDIETTNTTLNNIETDIETVNTNLENIETDIETTNTTLNNIEMDIETTNTNLTNIEDSIAVTNTHLTHIEDSIGVTNSLLQNLETENHDSTYISGFEIEIFCDDNGYFARRIERTYLNNIFQSETIANLLLDLQTSYTPQGAIKLNCDVPQGDTLVMVETLCAWDGAVSVPFTRQYTWIDGVITTADFIQQSSGLFPAVFPPSTAIVTCEFTNTHIEMLCDDNGPFNKVYLSNFNGDVDFLRNEDLDGDIYTPVGGVYNCDERCDTLYTQRSACDEYGYEIWYYEAYNECTNEIIPTANGIPKFYRFSGTCQLGNLSEVVNTGTFASFTLIDGGTDNACISITGTNMATSVRQSINERLIDGELIRFDVGAQQIWLGGAGWDGNLIDTNPTAPIEVCTNNEYFRAGCFTCAEFVSIFYANNPQNLTNITGGTYSVFMQSYDCVSQGQVLQAVQPTVTDCYSMEQLTPYPETETATTGGTGGTTSTIYDTEPVPVCLDTGTDTIQAFLTISYEDNTETGRFIQDANGAVVTGLVLPAKDCIRCDTIWTRSVACNSYGYEIWYYEGFDECSGDMIYPPAGVRPKTYEYGFDCQAGVISAVPFSFNGVYNSFSYTGGGTQSACIEIDANIPQPTRDLYNSVLLSGGFLRFRFDGASLIDAIGVGGEGWDGNLIPTNNNAPFTICTDATYFDSGCRQCDDVANFVINTVTSTQNGNAGTVLIQTTLASTCVPENEIVQTFVNIYNCVEEDENFTADKCQYGAENETYYINGINCETFPFESIKSYSFTIIEGEATLEENGVLSPFSLPVGFSEGDSYDGCGYLENDVEICGLTANTKIIISILR